MAFSSTQLTPETQTKKPFSVLDNPVTRAIQTIFPGKKVGEAIGTLGGYAVSGFDKNYDTSAPSPVQVGADIAQGALTVAAPGVGRGTNVGGRILTNTALGASLGGTGAIAEGKSVGDVAKSSVLGGALGGGISATSEALGALVNNLPKWLTKSVLPKVKDQNLDYALQNTKLGSVSSMLEQSTNSVKNYEQQVQTILSHPEFKAVAENTPQILEDALSSFPNSEYTNSSLINNAKKIAPEVKGLITKMEAGQADIQELNTIRKALDQATKSVYTTLNRPPETKALGAALSNALRDYVQTNAPETQTIFQNYSKEIDLQKALTSLNKKTGGTISFRDILAGGSGFAHSGFKGALEAILLERGLLSPAGRMAGAKAISALGKSAPVVKAVVAGAKAPLINKATK